MRLIAIVAIIVLSSQDVAAQRMCGESVRANSIHLAWVAQIFTESEHSPLRTSLGLSGVSPSDTIIVVTSDTTCGTWLPSVEGALESIFGEPLTLDGIDLAFYRIGPYMVVSQSFIPPPGEESTLLQRVPLLIFEWMSKDYVDVLVI